MRLSWSWADRCRFPTDESGEKGMAASGGRSVGPKLSVLETSRSIRRALISNAEDSPQRSPAEQQQQPLLLRSKTFSGEHGLPWSARAGWLACFVAAVVVTGLVLSTGSTFHDWNPLAMRCPGSSAPTAATERDGAGAAMCAGGQQQPHGPRQRAAAVSGGHLPGEVDAKCRARSEHLRYRRADRRAPPSARLARALDEYAALQARCAKKNWGAGALAASLANSSAASSDSCKYLVYIEGWEGLGNRFLSLVTAFVYAMVTDRVLLLDSRRNMSKLLCEPFNGSSWMLPADFPFRELEAGMRPLGGVEDEAALDRMPAVALKLRHLQSPDHTLFFRENVQQRLAKVPWIVWESNQYYVTRLFALPTFWARLSPLFDDPSRVFTQLSRHLLLPTNPIWATTERVYRAYLAAERLIGIQLRTPNVREFAQPVHDRMMRCLLDDRILPRISGMAEPARKRPARGPGATAAAAEEERTTAIFVASLQRGYYKALHEFYAERSTEDGGLVAVHTMASEGSENGSFDQSVKALVDMWLLSFSDSLVTSGWSTFGYVAQGLGAVKPYIINTDLGQRTSCDAGHSPEPCTHYPFISADAIAAAANMTAEQRQWIRKHLKTCQDEAHGLQLVSG